MMQRLYLAAVLAVAFISSVSAECANGCNGHGKCTSYDMCICNRNWQASDCSESKFFTLFVLPVLLYIFTFYFLSFFMFFHMILYYYSIMM